jgi:UDP-N-acetylmuramoyl-L-alanyl-D-glutamate--2,6-diaminopimelate ligase
LERRLSSFFTKETAEKAGLNEVSSEHDPLVTAIEYDSRNVKPGNIFFALSGLRTDGSLYINDAVKNRASVIVHETNLTNKNENVVYLKVNNARFAMSPISAAFYDFPSRDLLITGITGTEGKSTVVYLVWQLLKLLGKKAGFISTVQHCIGSGISWNSEHQTTPEAPIVQRLLREMADNGCEYAVLESSSHGLSEKTNRLGDVNFCSGVLTNLTHEHLEFHGTWEQYRYDKANLFRALDLYTGRYAGRYTPSFEPFGVINADDNSLQYFKNATNQKTFTYSPSGKDADIIMETIKSGADGNCYSLYIPSLKEHIKLKDKLPGAFNSANVMAALLTVSGLTKLSIQEIAPFVKDLEPVKGRMTSINKGQPFEVVVDYAHTPSSFQAVFPPLRERMNKTGGRIISVFGSAGERDTIKRAQQGQIAALYSDIIFITDEDPRGENPMDILEEINKGIITEQSKNFIRDNNLFLVPDRPSAIRGAFSHACKGDLVLLLGKGHENSIIYADKTLPYDEFEEAEKALCEMGFSG